VRWLVLCSVLVGATAHAQPNLKKEAAEHFTRGEAAQAAGHWRDAIAEYEQAYAALPHANALFNIAFCYEQLAEWARAADYYQSYLDLEQNPPDTVAVTDKIAKLRKLADAARPLHDTPRTQPIIIHQRPIEAPPPPPPPPAGPQPGLFHLGASYGLGYGEVPVERYLAHGGIRLAGMIDVDAIFGAFGKNDYALGGMARFNLLPGRPLAPFVRVALTLGYAKQDASSIAETKLPLGFEVGGGLQFGHAGVVTLDAVVRYVRGGWDSMTTTAESYANDSIAVAFDFGFVFDIGVSGGGR